MDTYEKLISVDQRWKADEIIKKAKDEMCGLLDQEVFDMLEEIDDAKRKLDELETSILIKESRLKELEENIKREEEYDISNAPKSFLKRIVKEYTDGYAPGDRVFRIKPEYETVECPMCKGKKKVLAEIDGLTAAVTCPTCSGSGSKRKTRYVVSEDTVSEVHLKLCFHDDRVGIWNNENVFVRGSDFSVRPDKIYRTREEAEEKINELNQPAE